MARAKTKVKVKGIGKAIANADKYSLVTEIRVKNHIRTTAERIQNGARRRARVLTGEMRDSIKAQIEKNGLSATVGPTRPDGWKFHFHEFGTVKMSAQPMLTPAYEEEKPKFESVFKAIYRKV